MILIPFKDNYTTKTSQSWTGQFRSPLSFKSCAKYHPKAGWYVLRPERSIPHMFLKPNSFETCIFCTDCSPSAGFASWCRHFRKSPESHQVSCMVWLKVLPSYCLTAPLLQRWQKPPDVSKTFRRLNTKCVVWAWPCWSQRQRDHPRSLPERPACIHKDKRIDCNKTKTHNFSQPEWRRRAQPNADGAPQNFHVAAPTTINSFSQYCTKLPTPHGHITCCPRSRRECWSFPTGTKCSFDGFHWT